MPASIHARLSLKTGFAKQKGDVPSRKSSPFQRPVPTSAPIKNQLRSPGSFGGVSGTAEVSIAFTPPVTATNSCMLNSCMDSLSLKIDEKEDAVKTPYRMFCCTIDYTSGFPCVNKNLLPPCLIPSYIGRSGLR